MLWLNWVRERASAEGVALGSTSDAVLNMRRQFMRGLFDDELDFLVASRTNASAYALAGLASIPAIQRAVRGQASRLSDSEVLSQSNQAAEAKFKQLAEAINQDKQEFGAAVKQHADTLGMEVMRELARQSAEREKAETVMTEVAETIGFRVNPAAKKRLGAPRGPPAAPGGAPNGSSNP